MLLGLRGLCLFLFCLFLKAQHVSHWLSINFKSIQFPNGSVVWLTLRPPGEALAMSLSAYVLPWPGTSILMRYDCVKDLSFIKCNRRRYFPWAATPPLGISFFCVFVIQRIHCCCLHVHGSLERASKALCSSHLIWKVFFFCKSTHSEVL